MIYRTVLKMDAGDLGMSQSFCLFQATKEPVVPRDAKQPQFRPISLLIPFTVQQGSLSGGCRNRGGASGPGAELGY